MSDAPRESGEPTDLTRCHNPERRRVAYSAIQPISASGTLAVRSRNAEPDPDAELVERWRGGETRAFELLVERHQRPVFRLALRMLGNRDDAEDVAQETFLNLYRYAHRFRGESRFSTFVYRVAANAALNRRRTLGRSRARKKALAERQAAGDHLPASPRDPEDAAFGEEARKEVQSALLELPADLRIVTILYDLEGVPYSEIASALQIAEGTVKSRIHRARNALRRRLRALHRPDPEGTES